MEKFEIIPPSPMLAPFVKHYWILENDDSYPQRIIPTGNIELVFHRGYPMEQNGQKIPYTSICGQTSTFVDLKPTGKVNMIVAVFHPFGAKAFFDIPINELSNYTVSADDLNNPSLKELGNKLLTISDNITCIKLIETFLIHTLHSFKEYNFHRLHRVIHAINQCDSKISISHLADTVCLSNKQFQRIFNEYVGINPKEFMRIVRFHKALFILQRDPSICFTHVAYESGYYDQSHMTNEFKKLSGYTPSEYLTICKPYSDYFSH